MDTGGGVASWLSVANEMPTCSTRILGSKVGTFPYMVNSQVAKFLDPA